MLQLEICKFLAVLLEIIDVFFLYVSVLNQLHPISIYIVYISVLLVVSYDEWRIKTVFIIYS